ncbi:MAG: ribbon-helix-helix protein, CopG family [Candidatus Limnocylindria bacterium]
MIRTQISLTEEQMHALRREARLRRISMAAVVRQAVDAELGKGASEAAWDRAMSVVGAFRSGLGDVAERHDDYLAEDFMK